MPPKTASKFVSYLRVSTARQGKSGLGLDAQREAVRQFVTSRAGRIIAPEFVEVESGKRDDRPELVKALKRCRLTSATLVVAKLDRLSRNAAFLMTLRDSCGVKATQAKAHERLMDIADDLRAVSKEGLSLRAMAARLNAMDIKTAREATWTATAVQRHHVVEASPNRLLKNQARWALKPDSSPLWKAISPSRVPSSVISAEPSP